MAVAFSSAASDSANFVSSLSFAASTAGSDRAIFVTTGINSTTTDVTGITYDGADLNFVNRVIGGGFTVELWELTAPTTGSNTVVVTWNASASGTAFAGVMSFTGVSQGMPSNNFQSASGNSATQTITVTSKVDDFVLDSLMVFQIPTIGSGQTQRFTEGGFDLWRGSTEAGAASVTMSWTTSISSTYALVGVNVNQVQERRIMTVT